MQDMPAEITLFETPNTSKLEAHLENPIIYSSDRVRLFKYANMVIDGQVCVEYARKQYNGEYYGRYFPKNGYMLSATYQWRRIRATLFAETHDDIDIVNCHPVLLEQLYKKEIRLDCPALTRYIHERAAIIESCHIDQAAIDRYNKNNKDYATKRDIFKNLFTIVLYGGTTNTFERQFQLTSAEYTLPPFFREFYVEIQQINANILKSETPHIKKLIADVRATPKQKINDNSILSVILQDLEARIVSCAMNQFRSLSHSQIEVYTYDGFMVTKDPNIHAICEKLTKKVQKLTSYAATFIPKPFEEPLAPSMKILAPIRDPDDKRTINLIKKLRNVNDAHELILATCAFIAGGGSSRWLLKHFENETLTFNMIAEKHARSELGAFFMTIPEQVPQRLPGRPKNAPASMITVEKKHMLYNYLLDVSPLITYDSMNFIPYLKENAAPENVFNLFSGFANKYEENFIVNRDIIAPLLNHISDIWSARDEITYNYILNWLAHIIQKPSIKMGVALLLKSTSQGAGKNIICEFICKKVIGARYTTTVSNSNNILNKFNSILENKILTVVDEIAECDDFFKLSDILKGQVTQTEISIERKGLEQYTVHDYNNLILLTNNVQPVKIEATDRRFFAQEVSNERANDKSYFDPLNASLTDECGKHFFHYLAQRNISNFKASPMPDTRLKIELKILSLSMPLRFLFEIASGNIFHGEILCVENPQIIRAPTSLLFTAFGAWALTKRVRHNVSELGFAKEISKILTSQKMQYNGITLRGILININELKNKCNALIPGAIVDD